MTFDPGCPARRGRVTLVLSGGHVEIAITAANAPLSDTNGQIVSDLRFIPGQRGVVTFGPPRIIQVSTSTPPTTEQGTFGTEAAVQFHQQIVVWHFASHKEK